MLRRFRWPIFGLALIQAGALSTNAHLIYSFSGMRGNEEFAAPDSELRFAAATPIRRGPMLKPDVATDAFNSNNWPTSEQLSPDAYYAFGIGPNPGYRLTLTVLKIDERGSSTGIRNWSVRSSLDEFQSDLAVFAISDNTFRFKQSIELGPEFNHLTGPVEFRLYGYNAVSSGGAWRLVNVELDGYVTAAQPALRINSSGVIRWNGLPNHPYHIQRAKGASSWTTVGTNVSSSIEKMFQVKLRGVCEWFRVWCPEHRQHIDP